MSRNADVPAPRRRPAGKAGAPDAAALAGRIRDVAGEAPPAFGLILGSGLGYLTEMVDGVAIPYGDLPGFPSAGVSGHVPQMVIGQLADRRVALFGGRAHYYEHGRADVMRLPLEVLRALGCDRLILTNAAGSLREAMPPGSLMLLSDHISFSGMNPLIGVPGDARFVAMHDAHDYGIRMDLKAAARAEGIGLPEGVYGWFSGPSFETPAEIRAARVLGMDAVGMSTVPEVILARYLGIRCAAISVITNMAAGLSDERISHDLTKQVALEGAGKLERVLRRFLTDSAS